MIKVHQLGYVLLWIGIATLLGHSQEPAGDYVPPSEAVPRGEAPRMQVQLLSRGKQTQQYAVIFYQGDEAFSGLQEFAEKYHVTSAHFTCAPQKPRTASGDTLFALVFMMQTAQDVLNCDPTIARQSMSRVQLRKVLRRRRLRSSWT